MFPGLPHFSTNRMISATFFYSGGYKAPVANFECRFISDYFRFPGVLIYQDIVLYSYYEAFE